MPPQTECGICMLEMNEKEQLIKCEKCTKLTHYSCYKKWMKNCIYCRNKKKKIIKNKRKKALYLIV